MKKIRYILLMLLLLPEIVSAASIGLTCPTTKIKSGDTFTCTIFGPEYCSVLEADLILPEGFTYNSLSAGDNYTFTKNENALVFTGSGLHSRVVSVISITAPKLTSEKKFDIKLDNIKFKYMQNETSYTVQNALTRNVTIQRGAVVPSSTTTLAPTTTALIKHTLTLNSNGSIDDDKMLFCESKSDKCSIDLKEIVSTPKEDYTFTNWSYDKECQKLVDSEIILSEDKTIYACFNEIKEEKLYLESITINNEVVEDFSKFKDEYNINYPKDKLPIVIDAIAVDQNVKVEIKNPENFIDGKNEVNIVLTKDDVTSIYKIIINITNEIMPTKETTQLKNIVLDNYDINFNPETYSYDLTVNYNTESIDVMVETNSPDDIYAVNGNNFINDGTIIKITVMDSETSKIGEYQITIHKKTFIEQYQNYLIASGVVVFCLIVYFIVGIKKNIFKKRLHKMKNGKPKKAKKEKAKKLKKKKDDSSKLETLD